MPSRRSQIRMTDSEIATFIEEQKNLQVATIGPDGAPHLTTLWFAVVDDAIVFETFTKSQKIRNLERDPRITVLLEDGTEYENLCGVQISGTAELHSDEDTVHRLATQVMVRNTPGIGEDVLSDAALHMARKRTAVVVKPDKVVSWDHRKLGGSY